MRKFAVSAVAAMAAAGNAWAIQAGPKSDAPQSVSLANYHALYASPASRGAATQSDALPRAGGYRSTVDAITAAPTFLWADAAALPSVGALQANALHEARARSYLRERASALGADADLLGTASLRELHAPAQGAVIARFDQKLGGIEVFGRSLNVAMTQGGKLVAIAGQFAPRAAVLATRTNRFDRSSAQAIVTAFADLGGRVDVSALRSLGRSDDYERFAIPSVSGDYVMQTVPRAKQVYFPLQNRLVAAWYVEIFAGNDERNDAYSYVISAEDGSVLFRNNLTAEVAFTYRMFADSNSVAKPYDEPLGNGFAPFTGSSYNQTITRTTVPSQLVTLQNSSLLSTNDAWLASGAKVTTGNNVDSYLDLGAPSGYSMRPGAGDLRAATTTTNTFDWPLAGDVNPATTNARNSAAVNLFFMNNWEHDFWYDRGFNEAAGNAQSNNYSRGGKSGDPILAEGQDYSGRNNANMATPADGSSPRMQMYLFDGLVVGQFTVTAPSSIAGNYEFGAASFGAQSFDLTNNLVLVNDGSGTTTDGCETLTNASAVAGKIALIDRGTCSFAQKTQIAQNAGAVAAVIANNVSGSPITMGADANYKPTIPAMMVTLDAGNTFKSTLGSTAVTARMRRDPAIDLDGTLDEGVIAHEFFHYVSNRLVNNGNGLGNSQGGGMGEGWSDFNTMLLQVRPDDKNVAGNNVYQGAYPVGTYVTGSYYFGIRRMPYSTDFTKNSLTFKHIQNGVALATTAPVAFGQDGASNAEVHNTGEVWANMLWEAYASLLNDARYTASFDTARIKMQNYVIGGLKMTPTNPTLVDARNGILSVAKAADCQDYLDIAGAFAKRGMGVNAVAPPSNSSTNTGVVEDYTAPSSCN